MNNREARGLLLSELARYRAQSHADLQRLLKTQDTYEIKGPTGTVYQVEIHAHWDSRRGGDLRILGAIDDMSLWRAIRPLCEDFIIAPDGHFVGEDPPSS